MATTMPWNTTEAGFAPTYPSDTWYDLTRNAITTIEIPGFDYRSLLVDVRAEWPLVPKIPNWLANNPALV